MTPMERWLEENAGCRYGNFIDGRWEDPGPAVTSIRNPARNEQVLGCFGSGSASDVERAVSAAERAGKDWRTMPGPDRGAILFKAADLLEERAQDIAFALSAEQGKVLAESFGEVSRAAKELRFCAGEASRNDGVTLPSEKRSALAITIREPLGVVAAIAPWNFPVVTPVRKIGPALAYGCTVVLKPANLTPWSAVKLMEVFRDAGVPAGVVNMVPGAGRSVGDALIRHASVKGISFTGSTKVGADINAQAGRRFVRTQLEMGGKNPALVLGYRDASKVAAQIASAAFSCSGQRCTAISRVIVLDSLHDELTDALMHAIQSVKVGPAWDPEATMGPLITEAHRISVLRTLAAGLNDGGQLRLGGNVLDDGDFMHGNFLEPTLVDRVDAHAKLAREEVFGPVLSVISVADEKQAFQVANSTQYGLAASIFTDDVGEALAFANESATGMVHVNHGTASEAHMPFGGVKMSGFGPYSIGHCNQEFFTTQKAVYLQP